MQFALSRDYAERFERDGFLVVQDFFTKSDADVLKRRAEQLVEDFELPAEPAIFSTRSHGHAAQRYFLDSGDRIRFFLEEEALDGEGRLRQDKAQSVNKLGHALHDLDPVFDAFSRRGEVERMVRGLGLTEPQLLQSMYIFKQPRIGGEVVWHQDATFLYTDPVSVVGLWFAVEDANVDNGCLWALPGAHRSGLKRRFVRDGDTTRFEEIDSTPWATDGAQALEVPRGTLVVLHGLLPHWSAPNVTARSRHAYSLHVIDGAAHYPGDNWLRRRKGQPLRGF